MIEKPSLPTAEEIAALPELEFLELDRDCDHINAEYDFKRAGIHALGAGAYGTLAASAMMSTAPYGALMGTLIAIPAAVYVWDAIQDIGKGVQDTTKSAAADTTLRVLYQHEGEAAQHGRTRRRAGWPRHRRPSRFSISIPTFMIHARRSLAPRRSLS